MQNGKQEGKDTRSDRLFIETIDIDIDIISVMFDYSFCDGGRKCKLNPTRLKILLV